MDIMLSGVFFLGGFLWTYLFLRQLMFNIMVAHPMIRKMNGLQKDLIASGATKYTIMSDAVCFVVAGLILFLILHFCKLYMTLSFAGGAVIAFVCLVFRIKPTNKAMFDLFSNAYYRFIPDDELRTIVYNKDYGKIKARLKNMGIRETFLPEFK